jgi:hypothetical protein
MVQAHILDSAVPDVMQNGTEIGVESIGQVPRPLRGVEPIRLFGPDPEVLDYIADDALLSR